MDHIDTSKAAEALECRYRAQKKAVTVSFRSLVPWLPYNSPRFTHQIHTYPAKVIPQIPNFFLNCRSLLDRGSTVLDPFCGSGTIPLEASLLGMDCVVSDANPLARLITKVKTTPISPTRIAKGVALLRSEISTSRASTPPNVVNITHWYTPVAIRQLARIAACIRNLEETDFKNLCCVALSTCARKMSLADPRVSVPVRLNPARYPKTHWLHSKSRQHLNRVEQTNAIDLFFSILTDSAVCVSSLWPVRSELGGISKVFSNSLGDHVDALTHRNEGSVDAVITSPPYLGAQKYVRATSLSLGWLALATTDGLKALEDITIGREHFRKQDIASSLDSGVPAAEKILKSVRSENRLRAHIAARYLVEMKEVIHTCVRLLKKGGSFILVSGSNQLCGRVFKTTEYLHFLCLKEGLSLRFAVNDNIHSRGLMTRRNKTAGLIPFESVAVFQKQ